LTAFSSVTVSDAARIQALPMRQTCFPPQPRCDGCQAKRACEYLILRLQAISRAFVCIADRLFRMFRWKGPCLLSLPGAWIVTCRSGPTVISFVHARPIGILRLMVYPILMNSLNRLNRQGERLAPCTWRTDGNPSAWHSRGHQSNPVQFHPLRIRSRVLS